MCTCMLRPLTMSRSGYNWYEYHCHTAIVYWFQIPGCFCFLITFTYIASFALWWDPSQFGILHGLKGGALKKLSYNSEIPCWALGLCQVNEPWTRRRALRCDMRQLSLVVMVFSADRLLRSSSPCRKVSTLGTRQCTRSTWCSATGQTAVTSSYTDGSNAHTSMRQERKRETVTVFLLYLY